MSLREQRRHRSLAHFLEATTFFSRSVLDFVYPPRCLLCDIDQPPAINDSADGSKFCEPCVKKLVPSGDNPCLQCGTPLGPYTDSANGCPVCRNKHFAFDEVIRLGVYRDELRIACLMAKNPVGGLLGRALTDLLLQRNATELKNRRFDIVIPVPEHWFKRFTRPQYAAETIAGELARQLNIRLNRHILRKHQWTPKQATSPLVERRQQQRGVFRVSNSSTLREKTILLVDDILTTGATADEAARTLKRAGAKKVIVAVLAVSPP